MTPEEHRKLDAEVAVMVIEKAHRQPNHGSCCTCQECGWDHDNCQCGYSTEIEKAWQVVEKLRENFYFVVNTNAGGRFDAEFSPKNPHKKPALCMNRDTAPEAICRAALEVITAYENPTRSNEIG